MSSADRTSWTLILGAAAGQPLDQEAFSYRYEGPIRAYLAARWHRDRSHDQVLDATQDVMVECFKEGGALSRVDPSKPGGFRAYLYGVVRNVALMSERRFARRREVDVGGDLEEGVGIDPDKLGRDEASLSMVFDREFARSVTRQARELVARRSVHSPQGELRYRALSLQFEEGLPPRDVADRMQVPVERVYQLLRDARREYREALLEIVGQLHPNSTAAQREARCIELLHLLQ